MGFNLTGFTFKFYAFDLQAAAQNSRITTLVVHLMFKPKSIYPG
jgi:hypothetical protein